MPNDLTGNYDVVAEFTLGAANRVLAAMHRGRRLAHSWSLRVDDYTHLHFPSWGVVRSVVDVFGEALVDTAAVAAAPGPGPRISAASAVNPNLDPAVNLPPRAPAPNLQISSSRISETIDPAVIGLLAPRHLTGVAQLQLGASTVTLASNSDSTVVVHTPVMARYVRDPDSLDIPYFLRGEFQITIGVKRVSSAAGAFIEVDMAGKTGNANFNSAWASSPLTPQDLDAINKALLNSLSSSFQPSSAPLPPNILNMQFKTLWGAQPALAILMDVPGGFAESPDPGSVGNVFLHQDDDFALAIRGEDVTIPFASAVNDAINPFRHQGPFENTTTISTLWGNVSYTIHTYTTVDLGIATLTLVGPMLGIPGGILLTIPAHVHFWNDSDFVSAPDDFDFTIVQIFDLNLAGREVSLQFRGPVSVEIPSSVDGQIANGIRNNAQALFTNAWNNPTLQGKIQQQVNGKLSLDNLQGFLKSMMNPVPNPGSHPVEEVDPNLFYTSYEITNIGIVLHGVLQVPAWPLPDVEFSFGPSPDATDHPFPWFGPRYEYNALNSWIPGGTIHEFVWQIHDGPVELDDRNTFVFKEKNPSGIVHLCLTIKGTRITAAGPVLDQPVTAASFCAWHIRLSTVATLKDGIRAANRPQIALAEAATSGQMSVTGHASPWAAAGSTTENAANLIVHFPDENSLANLAILLRALLECGRTDAAAAILVVISPEQLSKIKPVDGVMFADDDQAWARLFHIERLPSTLLIGTTGEIVWTHQGELSVDALAAALKKNLIAGGRFTPRMLKSNVRPGQPAPNFFLEPARGQKLTLRKLAGRPVVLVFWRTTSQASLETLRDLQKTFANQGSQGPVLLAINDGESAEVAQKAASDSGVSAIVVSDPDQAISLAYGVNLWPTTIFLDPQGLVADVRYGRFAGELAKLFPTVKPSPVQPGTQV
jgi:peroxiredoxin